MQKILKEIQTGNIKNFYLIFGEENYLKDYFISQVKKMLISEEFADMNFNIISDDIESIINSASSLPFMNKNRLTVIKDSGLFYTGKKTETEKFLNALNNFPDYSVVLFCETKIDKRNKLYKKISECGQVCEIKKPSNRELTKWITKVCEANKKIIYQQNASLILEITMHDMNFLKNEIEKLIAYTSSGQIKNIDQEINREITEKEINLLCTKSLEAKIFDLIASIGNKNLKTAIENYNSLIFTKEQPLMILAMISRQFVLLLQTKIFVSNGYDINTIAQKLNTRTFAIYDCVKQCKNFSEKTLISAIKECTEIDFKIKTGKLNDKVAVEMLIIKYSMPENKNQISKI